MSRPRLLTPYVEQPQTFPLPGLYGWAATLGVVVAYDGWAMLTHRPTMSRTLGHYLGRPLLGPVLAGGLMGLAYHLLIEERLVQTAAVAEAVK